MSKVRTPLRFTKGRHVALVLKGVEVCCRTCHHSMRKAFPQRLVCALQGCIVHPEAKHCEDYGHPLMPGVTYFEDEE